MNRDNCLNCGQLIEYSEGGQDWYHFVTGYRLCTQSTYAEPSRPTPSRGEPKRCEICPDRRRHYGHTFDMNHNPHPDFAALPTPDQGKEQ